MSLTIVMTTHTREPSYLEESLKSYHETCPHPLNLLVHETVNVSESLESKRRVEALLAFPIRTIKTLTDEENAEKQSLGTRVRVAHATRLALEMADGECILFQDDVKFSPGWLGKLADHLSALEERDNALVSLYSHRQSQVEGLVRWDPKTYWGLQGMFFGKAARLAAIEKAFQTSGPARLWPKENNSSSPGADVRLQKFLLDNSAFILYAVYPSLVQHTGMVSSIASKMKDMKSPTFQEPRSPVTWPKSHLKRSR